LAAAKALERGLVVDVAKDATAASWHPEWGDGHKASHINFEFLAHAVGLTDEVVKTLDEVAGRR
jgi:hypothetical protein